MLLSMVVSAPNLNWDSFDERMSQYYGGKVKFGAGVLRTGWTQIRRRMEEEFRLLVRPYLGCSSVVLIDSVEPTGDLLNFLRFYQRHPSNIPKAIKEVFAACHTNPLSAIAEWDSRACAFCG